MTNGASHGPKPATKRSPQQETKNKPKDDRKPATKK